MNSVAKITRRPWTLDEDELLAEMLLREVDYGNAGKALDRTYASVNNRAIKLGLSKTKLNLPRAARSKKEGTDKKSKTNVKKTVRTNKRTSALMLKVRNYRIVVSALALAEAATLTMLLM